MVSYNTMDGSMKIHPLLNMEALASEIKEKFDSIKDSQLALQSNAIDQTNIEKASQNAKNIIFTFAADSRILLTAMEADSMLGDDNNRIYSGATLYPIIMDCISLGYCLAMREKSMASVGIKPDASTH